MRHTPAAAYFNPRPPRGGRQLTRMMASFRSDFNPRPPRGGRPDAWRHPIVKGGISIHALREEGDRRTVYALSRLNRFQSTPSARRATSPLSSSNFATLFQSTPSARRATRSADQLPVPAADFNPRPPRGGRRRTENRNGHADRFQSTPSARRATASSAGPRPCCSISIHALREEGDPVFFISNLIAVTFQSTPSARRATCLPRTTPARTSYFNPRPPRGGRRAQTVPGAPDDKISIHALREEGDQRPRRPSTACFYFNPRPPRGGRRSLTMEFTSSWVFQSTPSARRATCGVISPFNTMLISIHALREEGDCRRRFWPISDSNFNPRPPRGGRQLPLEIKQKFGIFQSTPSARRATLRC